LLDDVWWPTYDECDNRLVWLLLRLLIAFKRRCAGFGSTFRPLTKCSFCERIFSTISFESNTRKAKPRLRPVDGSCFIEQSTIVPNFEKYSRKSSCVVSQVNPPIKKTCHRTFVCLFFDRTRWSYRQIISFHLQVLNLPMYLKPVPYGHFQIVMMVVVEMMRFDLQQMNHDHYLYSLLSFFFLSTKFNNEIYEKQNSNQNQ